jgi:hypothetical protein
VRLITIAAVLFAFVLWVHLFMFSDYLFWDSHVFLLIGRWFGEGLLPYRDLWEVKPPGIFFYVAAVFAALPKALWSLRVADFCFHLFGAAAFYRLCRVEANRTIALVATCFWSYFAHHREFSATGLYTEEYSAILAVAAVSAAAAFSAKGVMRSAFASGVAVSGAVLFKQPAAAAALPALLLILSRPRARALLAFAGGGILPLCIVVAFFWLRGGIDAFLDCNLWYPLLYTQGKYGAAPLVLPRLAETSSHLLELFREYPVLAAALIAGFAVSILRPNRFRIAVVSWVTCDFLFLAAQGHYFQHHYIQIFPAIFLSGAIGAAWLFQPRRQERWALSAARLALASAVVALAWPHVTAVWQERRPQVAARWNDVVSGPERWRVDPGNPDDEEDIARYVRERTAAGDRIHVHGYNPTVLATYWSAGRLPASRFFHALSYGDTYLVEQLDELKWQRPALVVVVGEPLLAALKDWLAAEYALETVKWHNYRAEIWVRKDRAREQSTR